MSKQTTQMLNHALEHISELEQAIRRMEWYLINHEAPVPYCTFCGSVALSLADKREAWRTIKHKSHCPIVLGVREEL
jgi:hypothetical protein